MKLTLLLSILTLLLVSVSSVNEIQMTHHKRTPRETARFIQYLNRDPML